MSETTTKRTPKLKTWKVDAGNSTIGACGFCIYNLRATTKEQALQKARAFLPESLTGHGEDEDGNPATVIAYFNAEALTLDDIEEVPDEENGNDGPVGWEEG